MKNKKPALILIIIISFFLPAVLFAELDIDKALAQAGITDWSPSHSVTRQKIKPITRIKAGSIEGNASIDTKLEALTGFWLAKVYTSELPKGKVGALRLASMWLFKKAVNPKKNTAGVNKALAIIRKKSGLSMRQVKNYFKKTISKEIMKYAKPRLSKYYGTGRKLKTVVKPILNYFLNPSSAGIEAMAKAAKKSKNISAYIFFISDINMKLSNKVSGALRKVNNK